MPFRATGLIVNYHGPFDQALTSSTKAQIQQQVSSFGNNTVRQFGWRSTLRRLNSSDWMQQAIRRRKLTNNILKTFRKTIPYSLFALQCTVVFFKEALTERISRKAPFMVYSSLPYKQLVSLKQRRVPGGHSQNNLVGVCASLLKTLTLFMTKICDFRYPILICW